MGGAAATCCGPFEADCPPPGCAGALCWGAGLCCAGAEGREAAADCAGRGARFVSNSSSGSDSFCKRISLRVTHTRKERGVLQERTIDAVLILLQKIISDRREQLLMGREKMEGDRGKNTR